MGKMNIKLPTPTHFDERFPQFNEWGEVKAHVMIHNAHIEDYMDESSRSVETVNIANIQDDYTTKGVNRLRQQFPTIPTKNEEYYDEYNEMTLKFRKKKDDIRSFSQTLNYVLVHSTNLGSEAHSMVRRIMKQSNGFEAWRQLTLHYASGHRAQQFFLLRTIMQPSWDSKTTKQFTQKYYM
eukprot:4422362-Amphidinium_carterae.1